MKRKKKTPLVVFDDGNLYIELRESGIHHLIPFIDGMNITTCKERGKDKLYLLVKDARDWHAKELKESGGQSGSQGCLEALTKMQAKFEAGEMVMENTK